VDDVTATVGAHRALAGRPAYYTVPILDRIVATVNRLPGIVMSEHGKPVQSAERTGVRVSCGNRVTRVLQRNLHHALPVRAASWICYRRVGAALTGHQLH